MTVAELIEKLSALPDKTGRVVKSAGPWDGEPSLIYDGYVDKDMQFPVHATDSDAIHTSGFFDSAIHQRRMVDTPFRLSV